MFFPASISVDPFLCGFKSTSRVGTSHRGATHSAVSRFLATHWIAVSAHLWRRSHFRWGNPIFVGWNPWFLLMKLMNVPISVGEHRIFCCLNAPCLFLPCSNRTGISQLPPSDTRLPRAPKLLERAGSKCEDCAQRLKGNHQPRGHRIMLGNIGKMMGNIRKPSFFPNSSRKKGCYIRMFLLFFPAILEGVRMDLDKAGHSACAVLELVVHISTTLVFFPIDLHDHPWEKFCASGQQFFRESSMISYDNGNSGNHPWSVKTIVGSSGNHHPSTIFSSMIIWEFVLSTRTAQRW